MRCLFVCAAAVLRRKMNYAIRRSQRARHVWLRFTGEDELVVVVPRTFDLRRVPGIIESNRDWIRRSAERMASRCAVEKPPVAVALPERISLPAVGFQWSVEYRATSARRVTVRECSTGILRASGAITDKEECRRALLRWLRRQAREHLTQHLRQLAAEYGFAQPRVTVRSQRTRWASCSRSGALSLNLRLLFVEPALMRHVMLHELCHTRRMDHSKAFWVLLEKYDPNWRNHRRMLRVAWGEVPAWVMSPVESES